MRRIQIGLIRAVLLAALLPCAALGQSNVGQQLAELTSLREKVRDPDTRTRVSAFHRVWSIGLVSDSSDVKSVALDLMREPVASASDHIRMPAVYAIAEIANNSSDVQVKLKALSALREPMIASQLPIRLAAIDAVNSIVRSAASGAVSLEAIRILGEPVRSGNNGVRIPAINAVVQATESARDERACSEALELLTAPLDSMAAIGGMEVRMMAVVAVERIGLTASDTATRAKALGMLQAHANKGSWEPEARQRASEAASKLSATIK